MAVTQSPELSTAELLASLERFVVENDDLLTLEERIGRLNIFDALGVARAEIRHSNFLAWLLDPAESHGQGSLFLRALLIDVLAHAEPPQRPLSPIELDGTELRGVEIRREWKHIDLLIVCQEPPLIVATENKIDSGEHSGQLGRYKRTLSAAFPSRRALFVFLTPDGRDASEEEWVPYSYRELHAALARCRNTYARSIGDDVLVFVDHYLRLIGSRFMDDPKIDELCKRIYRNHRQAIELIFERCQPGAEIVQSVSQALENDAGRWHVFNRTSQRVLFVPAAWLNWLPELSSLPKQDPRHWIFFWYYVNTTKRTVRLRGEVGPCTDTAKRRLVIERLAEIGLGKPGKRIKDRWTRFYLAPVLTWREGEEPASDEIEKAVKKSTDELWAKIDEVPGAIRPLFESTVRAG